MKSKLGFGQSEKRGLRRLRVGDARDFSAIVRAGDKNYECTVEDFHFNGIRLSTNSASGFSKTTTITSCELKYGQRVIASIDQPYVIRTIHNSFVLGFGNTSPSKVERNRKRLALKPSFKAIVLARDPIKIDTVLYFDLVNLSGDGLLLSTSFANRHLVKGLLLTQVQVVLPGIKIITVDLRIRHLSANDGRMQVGVSIEEAKLEDVEAMAQFALFGTVSEFENSNEERLNELRASFGSIKKLGAAIRIEILGDAEEYYDVLRVRFEAYRRANKVRPEDTFESMADEYDAHSIIVVARVNGTIVGTVRLVMGEAGSRFPLESYYSFQSLVKGKRADFYEVSRLAVDPKFQGADVMVKLFKEVARLTILNRKTTLCLATRALRKIYRQIGFRQISDEKPHPVLTGDTLAVMRVESAEFVKGSSMAAIAWDKVAREVADNLYYAQVIKRRPSRMKQNFKMAMENFLLRLKPAPKRRRPAKLK